MRPTQRRSHAQHYLFSAMLPVAWNALTDNIKDLWSYWTIPSLTPQRTMMRGNYLTADLFNSVVDSLKQKCDKRQEKRNEARVGLRIRILFHPTDEKPLPRKPQSAWCQSLSAKGIGLISDKAMKPGTRFVLSLPAAESGKSACVLYQVAQCKQSSSTGPYLIGARLVQRLKSPEKEE